MAFPKITVRGLMGAVLVVALALALGRGLRRISRERRSMVARHYHDGLVLFDAWWAMHKDDPGWDPVDDGDGLRLAIGYHEAMRQKWSMAADRPWLPVEPDPPPPPLPREMTFAPGVLETVP